MTFYFLNLFLIFYFYYIIKVSFFLIFIKNLGFLSFINYTSVSIVEFDKYKDLITA